MKLYRPSHLLPILLLITLASVSECRQKRSFRIFSAPPDSDQVYRGLNFPKHIDHVAQGGTIGLEYDARRLAGPVGSIWRRVKKFFRGDYKKDWNNILDREDKKEIPDKPWGKPWEEPVGGTEDPAEVTEEVIVKDEDINVEDRDGGGNGDDFVWNEVINPRHKLNDFREDDREKEWTHVRG